MFRAASEEQGWVGVGPEKNKTQSLPGRLQLRVLAKVAFVTELRTYRPWTCFWLNSHIVFVSLRRVSMKYLSSPGGWPPAQRLRGLDEKGQGFLMLLAMYVGSRLLHLLNKDAATSAAPVDVT